MTSRPPLHDRPGANRTRGTLLFLATLLVASASIRFGTGIGEALASEPGVLLQTADSHPLSPDPAALLEALRERETRVGAREAAFEARMQALAVSEAQIRDRLEELREAEERLAATLALSDQAAERDLARLTAVYENMKPKDAAILFEEMEPRFAAGFLARMQPETAAALLAGLPPRKSYTISVILAGRHVSVPTE